MYVYNFILFTKGENGLDLIFLHKYVSIGKISKSDFSISDCRKYFFITLYSGVTSHIFHQNVTKKCCILIATKLIRGPHARDFIKNIATAYLNQR